MDGIYTSLLVTLLLIATVIQILNMTFLTMISRLTQMSAKDNHFQITNMGVCHKSVTHPFLFFAFSQIRNL